MSKHETRQVVARADAAQRLRDLAEQVAAGVVSLSGVEARVPEQIRMKVEVEHDEVEFKLRW